MPPQLAAALGRLDGLSFRQRALLLATLGSVMLYAWDQALMQPLTEQRRAQLRELEVLRGAVAATESEIVVVVEASRHDPDAPTQARIANLEGRIAAAREQLEQRTADLIDPRSMAAVLETVLARFDRLEFVAVESLRPEPLLPDAAAQPGMASSGFRHGMRIRFAGGYLDMLAYLRELEALPYGFFWDSVEYRVADYPQGEGSVVVYTLSRSADWIGT